MEYLVTMTTHVPQGTSEQSVGQILVAEAAHTRQLARQGRVLRLWRPQLQPGEWRTIGLFTANDSADLGQTLDSMPLRVWRTDDVTPLGPHPNDPGFQHIAIDSNSAEFLTTLVLTVPPGASPATVETMRVQEAERTRELAERNQLIRLWTLPGHNRSLGHWQGRDNHMMDDILRSLPMADWLEVDTVRLSPHPNDPVTGEVHDHLHDSQRRGPVTDFLTTPNR